MYYQFSFPETEFMIAPVCVNVTRENWYLTVQGQEKVLGELTRLGTQFGPEWEDLRIAVSPANGSLEIKNEGIKS